MRRRYSVEECVGFVVERAVVIQNPLRELSNFRLFGKSNLDHMEMMELRCRS